MNKFLKILITFEFLIFVNMQIFGQGMEDDWDDWDDWGDCYWCDDGWFSDDEDQYGGDDDDNGYCYLCMGLNNNNYCTCEPPITTYFYRDTLTILTYNLWRDSKEFDKHKIVINQNMPDVVALQEMLGTKLFKELKSDTGLYGEFFITSKGVWLFGLEIKKDYGIAMLWDYSRTGWPLTKNTKISGNGSNKRVDMIAEFPKFCFVCVHYSHNNKGYREFHSYELISDSWVQNCKKQGKPIYIAGDFNCSPWRNSVPISIFRDDGYDVLNDTTRYEDPPNSGKWKWNHATKEDGSMIDLILEYNTTPNKEIIWRGIRGFPKSFLGTVSDHKPYHVYVKFK
ncbi:MAG: endonuclease/exonuclease/phosphatase family protein [Marinilabiliaceae bacterium]|nr:endonuclease/exonuclease/phosphatase family protein [Marinilabiliaceae bacterium]